MTTTTFHNFPALPSELRLKIWKSVMPEESRIIPVRFDTSRKTYITTATNTIANVLLAINHESRSLYLERYSILSLSPDFPSRIYIDFKRDTLLFHDFECSPSGTLSIDLARAPDRNRIQHLAIDSCVWDISRSYFSDHLSEIRTLSNLKSIAVVLQPDRKHDHDPVVSLFRGLYYWAQEVERVKWYVELLREALVKDTEIEWDRGVPPESRFWLCRNFEFSEWDEKKGAAVW